MESPKARTLSDQILDKEERKVKVLELKLNKICLRRLLMIYNFIWNIFALIYPRFFPLDLETNEKRYTKGMFNILYNSSCLIFIIMLALKNKCNSQKNKSKKFEYLIHFIFTLKINIDCLNLFYQTPSLYAYYKTSELMFFYLTCLNIFLYYSIMSPKIPIYKYFHVFILFTLLNLLFLLNYFVFSPQLNEEEFSEFINKEIGKNIFYAFIIALSLKFDNNKQRLKTMKTYTNYLEKINTIFINEIENNSRTGLVVLKSNGETLLTRSYFEHILSKCSINKFPQVDKKFTNNSIGSSQVNKIQSVDTKKENCEKFESKRNSVTTTPKIEIIVSREESNSNLIKNISSKNLKENLEPVGVNACSRLMSNLNLNYLEKETGLAKIHETKDEFENSNIRSSRASEKKESKESLEPYKQYAESFLSNIKPKQNSSQLNRTKTLTVKNSNSLSPKFIPSRLGSGFKSDASSKNVKLHDLKINPLSKISNIESEPNSSSDDSECSKSEINYISSEIVKVISDVDNIQPQPKNINNTPDKKQNENFQNKITNFQSPKLNRRFSHNKFNRKQSLISVVSPVSLVPKRGESFNTVINNNFSINLYPSQTLDNRHQGDFNLNARNYQKDSFLSYIDNNQQDELFLDDSCVLNVFNSDTNLMNSKFVIISSTRTSITTDLDNPNTNEIKKQFFEINKSILIKGMPFFNFLSKLQAITSKTYYKENMEVTLGPYKIYLVDTTNKFKKSVSISILIKKVVYGSNFSSFFIFQEEKKSSLLPEINPELNNINRKRKFSEEYSLDDKFMIPTISPNASNSIDADFKNNSGDLKTIKLIRRNSQLKELNLRKNSLMFKKQDKNYNSKLSALLHDFKHIILDNSLYYKYIFNKYNIQIDEEELLQMNVMDSYLNSLILNITNFLKNSDNFLNGNEIENNQEVDLVEMLEMLIKVFNRRKIWENESNIEMGLEPSRINMCIYANIEDENKDKFRQVISNKNLLMSLFYNILSNSFKATKSGEIKIEMSLVKNKHKVLIVIKDTGSGIPDQVLRNWSKPFNTGNEAGGSGLGQFILGTIAKNLKIEMPTPEKNPNGQGTVFKMLIPLDPDKDQHAFVKNNSYSNMTNLFESENPPVIKQSKDLLKYFDSNKSYSDENDPNMILEVLCLDDDSLIINSIVNKVTSILKKENKNLKFNFDICNDFKTFFTKLSSSLSNNKPYNMFILDYNISMNFNGIDVAKIVDKIYQTFYEENANKFNINFLFVTEQAESIKQYFDNSKIPKIFDEGNVFSKSDHGLIASRLVYLLNNF